MPDLWLVVVDANIDQKLDNLSSDPCLFDELYNALKVDNLTLSTNDLRIQMTNL